MKQVDTTAPRVKPRVPKTHKRRPVTSSLMPVSRLVANSWRDFWRHKKVMMLIVAIVQVSAVVISLLTTTSSRNSTNGVVTTTSNPTVDDLTNFAAVFMNVALLMIALALTRGTTKQRLRAAYYDGSRFVLRFILAIGVVILGLLPALFALVIYNVAAFAGGGVSSTAGEQSVIIGLCLLIALPSFWFLTRYLLAPIAVVAEDLNPVAALVRARRVSLGRFWRLLARLFVLGVVILVVALAVVAPGFMLSLLVPAARGWASIYFEIAYALVILPYIAIYLANLYTDLAKTTDQ